MTSGMLVHLDNILIKNQLKSHVKIWGYTLQGQMLLKWSARPRVRSFLVTVILVDTMCYWICRRDSLEQWRRRRTLYTDWTFCRRWPGPRPVELILLLLLNNHQHDSWYRVTGRQFRPGRVGSGHGSACQTRIVWPVWIKYKDNDITKLTGAKMTGSQVSQLHTINLK